MTSPVRLLLVCVNESRRRECLAGLDPPPAGVDVRAVADRADFRGALENGDFELAIVDGSAGWLAEVPEAWQQRQPERPILVLGAPNPGGTERLLHDGTGVAASARREAPQAEPESEARFRRLSEATFEGALIHEGGTILDGNAALSTISGYRLDELIGQSVLRFLAPESQDAVRAHLAAGDDGPFEAVGLRKDGSRLPLEIHGCPLPLAGRQVRVVALRDISARKRAEEALARSEERYRRFFEAGLAGAYVTSADGRILDCNQAFVQILGFASLEQAIGASVTGLYADPGVRQQVLNLLRAQKDVVRVELHLRSVDGRPLVVMANMAPVLDEAGNLASIEGYLFDITDRRRLEEQLRQAQKMEAVGRLAGGIAHDFNNLLTAIAGYAELMLRHLGANDPLRKHAQGTLDAADRATTLTRQLLAFSRKQVLVRRPLDVNDVVADMEEMLRRVMGEDIRLVRGPRQSSWIVEADPLQVEQLLVNLAVNARDAMPQGGTLSIETADVELDSAFVLANPGAGQGPHVMLSVADTGAGMDDEVRSHLFEPFFTTKAPGKGTGLGLATVYGIVQQNGGSISVESTPGRGTVFRIYLPRSVREAMPLRPATAEVPILPVGAETILLVEDEELVRELGRDMLRMAGYRVLEAPHAGEALVVAERYPGAIHLLLTDVVMPDMNGRELAERLTAQRPETRVLYISGHTVDAVLSRGVEAGEMAFLQKPFRADTLLRKIRQVLDS